MKIMHRKTKIYQEKAYIDYNMICYYYFIGSLLFLLVFIISL